MLEEQRFQATSLVRLRRLVAFDRFLARLQQVAPGRWRLKGGLALDYRLPVQFRTTRDLDISRQDDEIATTEDFISAAALDLNDYFGFTVERTLTTPPELDDRSARYHLTASLAGRRFEAFSVDVSFTDPFFAAPDTVSAPALLAFADVEPISVPAIPVEQHIAEKVHAYTRVYANQRPTSREKDLIDLVLVQGHIPVSAGRLIEALEVTFAVRNTHPLPTSMPVPPPTWGTAYARMATEVRVNRDPIDGYQAVSRLLDPVLARRLPHTARWNPDTEEWEW